MLPRTPRILLLPALAVLALGCAGEPTRTSARTGAGGAELPRYVDVKNFFFYAPGISGGSQPSMEVVAGLRERGYSTIVNLRTPPEMRDIPEAETAAATGLAYYELPVSGNTLSLVLATRLQEILAEAPPGDVFIHCASGNRAAALWGLYLGLTEGLTPEEAVAAARRVGLTKDFLAARVREELGLAMPRPRHR